MLPPQQRPGAPQLVIQQLGTPLAGVMLQPGGVMKQVTLRLPPATVLSQGQYRVL
jgi:hypothetical protein